MNKHRKEAILTKLANLPRHLRNLAAKTEGGPRSTGIDFTALQKLLDAGRVSPSIRSKLMGRARVRAARGKGAPYADETAFTRADIQALRTS